VSHRQSPLRKNYLETLFPKAKIVPLGSSIKFCRIAEGKADFFLRQGRAYTWDTASGECILQEAGGITLTSKGENLSYSPKLLYNQNFYAASKSWDNALVDKVFLWKP
jgi:3'(2'), 5'-bisphosphate nucleotidase